MIRKFYDAAPNDGGGAFEKLVVGLVEGNKKAVEDIKAEMKGFATPAQIETATKAIEDKIANEVKAANEAAGKLVDAQKAEIVELKAQVNALDKLASNFKVSTSTPAPSFKSAFKEALQGKSTNGLEMKEALAVLQGSKGATVSMELKVDPMTNANSLTGDGVQTYNTRQALVPAQKLNFRDLIPSVQSPTLEYVTYFEDAKTGAIANQTEGEAKSTIKYNLTNVQKIQSYLAGIVTFTKQMLKNLPWLGGTLPRMLLRDFYKQENANFWTTATTAATPFNPGTLPADDVEAIITAIAQLESADFTASFGIVSKQQWARLAISTYTKGYYSAANAASGSVVITPGGMITIAGVPILSASWATDDKLLLLDVDYIERVEGESLNITFSYEDGDNWKNNEVSARVECLEVLNILRPDALLLMDFGNVTP
jgi:hypothetical protein